MVRVYLSIVFCGLISCLYSQVQDLHERVYLHPNTQVLVSGESLHFSAYTLSHQTGEISELSKILYVQLVGEDGPIFEQKIQLDQGRGSGAFFVNSLVPTGRYQLLAYTRWMRNFDDYFQLPITIINPFESELPKFQKDSILRISFHYPNGYLIDKIDAQVGFRIFSAKGSPGITEGKIIDASGAVVQSFSPAESGLGEFSFEPDFQELYRVLLEDETGTISFHEFMPIEEGGYDLELEKQTNGIVVTPRAVNRSVKDLLLETYVGDALWNSRKVVADEIQTISFESLPSEVFQVVLSTAGKRVFAKSVIPPISQTSDTNVQGFLSSYSVRDSLNFRVLLPEGTYSLSIHKKTNEIPEVEITAKRSVLWSALSDPFVNKSTIPRLEEDSDLIVATHDFAAPAHGTDSIVFLPEVRNELVSATLQSTTGATVANIEVALSFPGKIPQVKTGFTDKNGQVLFHHPSLLQSQEAYLSVLDNKAGWQFEVEEKFQTVYPTFDYSLMPFDSLAAIEIQERSVDNQIVNAFQNSVGLKVDSTKVLFPQLTQWNFEYALDDYERFPDFKEYFVEYIIGAGIKDNSIQIRKEYYRPEFQNRQLILLDGVPVSPRGILELDPYLVENVRVMMNRTYLGPSVFDGVVLIETYESDLSDYVPVAATKLEYQGISPASSSSNGSIQPSETPDRRIHLYWNPSLDWKGGVFQLNSVTSDVTGHFELRVEGFMENGKPVSIRQSFQVKR